MFILGNTSFKCKCKTIKCGITKTVSLLFCTYRVLFRTGKCHTILT
jgi:hypothetical protein